LPSTSLTLSHSLPFWPRAVQRLVLAPLWLGLPLSPIACALLSGQWRFIRHYAASVRQCARMLHAMREADVLARNLLRSRWWLGNLGEPEQVVGQCTHCGNCCVHHSCVFLSMDDSGHSRCGIYGNWFFKRLACGQYPVDALDIKVYACPSFKALPLRAGDMQKVIPIKPQQRVDSKSGLL
jgi:hypothetical protein